MAVGNFVRLVKKFLSTLSACGVRTAVRMTLEYLLFRFGFGDPVEKRRVQLSEKISEQLNSTVKYGPFKGLKFDTDSRWSGANRPSMLLGYYEFEVLDLIDKISKTNKFDAFINIGAADGYYGVGVLVGNLFQHAYCFEISEIGQRIIRSSAAVNGVLDRISVYGRATKEFSGLLQKEHLSNSVILVDIEGDEFEIFDKEVFRDLQKSIVIVEIHDWVNDAAAKTSKLKDDAAEFFACSEIKTSSRDLSKFEELRNFPDSDRWLMCSEGRPRLMSWWVFTPLATEPLIVN
jgi:hypothetical protein